MDGWMDVWMDVWKNPMGMPARIQKWVTGGVYLSSAAGVYGGDHQQLGCMAVIACI